MHKSLNAKALDACIKRAVELFGKLSTAVDEDQVDVLTWPQTWPNSACGSTQSGIYLQAFYVAPTVVVISPHGPVCVFHNGMVAGFLHRCTKGMKDAIEAVSIPGADDRPWWDEQRAAVRDLVDTESELKRTETPLMRRLPRKPYDLAVMLRATEYAKERMWHAKALVEDVEKGERLDKQECAPCYYGKKAGGSRSTVSPCGACGVDLYSGSTCVDTLCQACAAEHSACKHCGGDMDMTNRRKLKRS